MRSFVTSTLARLGYHVFEASDATAALTILDKHPEMLVLFTDVGLPGVNGRQLADEARQRVPDLKVLYTTGYARNAIVHHGRLDPGVDLLVKPFTIEQLGLKLQEVLERVRSSTAVVREVRQMSSIGTENDCFDMASGRLNGARLTPTPTRTTAAVDPFWTSVKTPAGVERGT